MAYDHDIQVYMEQTQQEASSNSSKSNTSKLQFALGLVSGIAIISIVGFIVLLTRGGGANIGSTETGGGGETETQGEPQKQLSLIDVAKAVDLDEAKFQECMDSGKHKDKVQKQYQDALTAGGQGTPYNIIIAQNGDTYTLPGAYPVESFKTIIDPLLKGEKPAAETPQKLTFAPVTEDDHIRGSFDAPVKIIEYSDFQCPFCARHHPTMKQVLQEYGEDKVAWVYRHFPLSSIHPEAQARAEASECALELGGNEKFWEYADKLFE